MKNKIYIKKLLVENEHSTPEARAERLKRIRNLANLSRKEICEASRINLNTYKGWELARFGGLPVDGAEKIIQTIAAAGVICSLDWLLYKNGPSPTLSASTSLNQTTAEHSTTLIEREFSIYKAAFENAILEQVIDDSLLPHIQKNDFVAGIMKFGQDIDFAIDKLCIVQTIEGRRFIRYLKQGHSSGIYSLVCANPFTKSLDIATLNVPLFFAAPVTRLYSTEPH